MPVNSVDIRAIRALETPLLHDMHCVVGSGPSGVACAHALLERGCEVLMLDAGLTLEEDRARAVEQLRASPPSEWDPRLLALVQEQASADASGLPQKLVFGSDFPYRAPGPTMPGQFQGVGLRPSFALGGLSNVWGAAMLPCLDADLADWPVKTAELASHYSAVLKLTGLAARTDDLAAKFPLYTDEPGTLELSRQASRVWVSLNRHRADLNRAGIEFGASRVAIQAKRNESGEGCIYCGQCMHGCPCGYIYNSAATVRALQKHPRFRYQGNAVVQSVAESVGQVSVRLRQRLTGEESTVHATRVYLAAGALPTARILLASRGDYDRALVMKDSQYFLVPLLLPRAVPDVRNEQLQTLSQLFLELSDPAVSRHTVHLQIYSYSRLLADSARHSLARFGLGFLASMVEGRLLVAQGFLHSDDSSKMSVTLRSPPDGTLQVNAELNPGAPETVRKVVRKLLGHWRQLGAVAVPPMVHVAEPGRSFHSGGAFPMRASPGPFESDTLGRPHGWQRVHAVDATVLPSIPATTITFTTMANAHRIACETAAHT